MKFTSEYQKYLFCLDIERQDISKSISESWEPDDSLLEEFYKRRSPQINKLKDFRKSQASKASWRRNRYSYMKGIKDYHKSTQGKKQHRQLGNWLATHNFYDGIFKDTIVSYKNSGSLDGIDEIYSCPIKIGFMSITERNNVLKAISSVRTHLHIESDYYRTLFEDLDFNILLDEAITTLYRVEKKFIEYPISILTEDLEFCIRVTDPESIITGISENYNISPDTCKQYWNNSYQYLESQGIGEERDGYYSILMSMIFNKMGVLNG